MTAVTANGLIYLMGGKDGTALPGGIKSTIYYARPNPDGNIIMAGLPLLFRHHDKSDHLSYQMAISIT